VPRATEQPVLLGLVRRDEETIVASGSHFPWLTEEECPNLLRTIIEDLPEIPRHLKAMD
jgi:hypothetical protein